MRKIAIVGAGQAGLQLGMGLLERGEYEVTLLSDRTGRQIAEGPMPATPIQFARRMEYERELRLGFWDDMGHGISGINFDVRDEAGAQQLRFSAPFPDGLAMGVDYRLKYPAWLEEYERRGGKLVIKRVEVKDLASLAAQNDLVVVAGGKGEISNIFKRDPDRSPPYTEPQRHWAAVIVEFNERERMNNTLFSIPGVGELAFMHQLCLGNKKGLGLLAISRPGGPIMKHFGEMRNGADVQKVVVEQMRHYCGDYAEVFENRRPVDEKSFVFGSILPEVRYPTAKLSAGGVVMGLGDSVLRADPLSSNGLNDAVVMTDIVTNRIIERGAGAFDEAWMNDVFDEFWEYGRYVFEFMRIFLDPPKQYMMEVLGAAAQFPAMAEDVVGGITNPPSFMAWAKDEATARAHVERRMGGS